MAEAGGRPQLTVVSTDGDSRVARLHRYIARRDDLRATFQTLWQKLEAGPVGAWQEEWAAAALRLFEVNAGPAVQMAFWRLSLAEAPRCEASALVAAADTAGGICRRCGSGAARAFLERTGLLLARTDGPSVIDIDGNSQGSIQFDPHSKYLHGRQSELKGQEGTTSGVVKRGMA